MKTADLPMIQLVNIVTVSWNVSIFHYVMTKITQLVHSDLRSSSVARFTERLITYLSPKTYPTTHLRPKTCLILKICTRAVPKCRIIAVKVSQTERYSFEILHA